MSVLTDAIDDATQDLRDSLDKQYLKINALNEKISKACQYILANTTEQNAREMAELLLILKD